MNFHSSFVDVEFAIFIINIIKPIDRFFICFVYHLTADSDSCSVPTELWLKCCDKIGTANILLFLKNKFVDCVFLGHFQQHHRYLMIRGWGNYGCVASNPPKNLIVECWVIKKSFMHCRRTMFEQILKKNILKISKLPFFF